jgi:hypothetical protein
MNICTIFQKRCNILTLLDLRDYFNPKYFYSSDNQNVLNFVLIQYKPQSYAAPPPSPRLPHIF